MYHYWQQLWLFKSYYTFKKINWRIVNLVYDSKDCKSGVNLVIYCLIILIWLIAFFVIYVNMYRYNIVVW